MTDRPIRVGVQLQPQQGTLAKMRETWLRVEEMGADTVFNWDHFHPLYGDPTLRITAQYAVERVRPARRGPPQVPRAGRALPPAGARSGRDRALDRRVQRRADQAPG